MRGRRVLGLALAGLLTLGVIAAIIIPWTRSAPNENKTTVRALVSSEKQSFFADPDVVTALDRAGYRLEITSAGSREIATTRELSGFDLAFPADGPQAERIRRDRKISTSYVPFFTPMAIATFSPIATLLTTAGVSTRYGDHYLFDMRRYLDLVAKDTRWSQLPGNNLYQTDKSILISSTDVRTSNSAALYLAIASYVSNGGNVVTDAGTADRITDRLAPLFLKQGYLEASSQEPFDDFMTIGMGKTPMVMIYEAQFRAHALARDGSLTSEMVLMYPNPTIYAKHTVVPLTPTGDAVGHLLTTDPQLQRLAVRHGFRTADADYGRQYAAERRTSPAPQLVNVVEPPSAETSERMISQIETRYKKGPG
ncbi:hypothetical protein [Candidatus Protofrankia californiensis]|uniref:hypothetical protein n=1 Tax=Candidatus Protofrankia californiensis TaxID=1839754 RepID=UPI001041328B|nr:hypothetical protein [Candidatus Protofrankia californiensis]